MLFFVCLLLFFFFVCNLSYPWGYSLCHCVKKKILAKTATIQSLLIKYRSIRVLKTCFCQKKKQHKVLKIKCLEALTFLLECQQFSPAYGKWISSKVKAFYFLGSRVGAVVRALAFHQCVPGSIPGLDVTSGLSLLVLSAPRGFSLCTAVFPSPQKPTSDLIWFDLRWFPVSPISRATVLS